MTSANWREFVERCATADRIVLVAPYIKLDALSITLDRVGEEAAIECLTRWSPLDIQAGVSDIACRTLVKRRGGSFRLHNQLHAKYYRADEYILIGSANLTRSGLGLSHSANLEILTQAARSFDWMGFEKNLLSGSREVSDEEYALWEQCPIAEANTQNQGFPIVDVGDWKPQTREPDYLWRVYSGRSLPSDEQYEPATRDLRALRVPSDLDQETFDGWIGAALKASAFVCFVLDHVSTHEATELWDAVCQQWNIVDRASAARCVETAQIWVRYYNPSALAAGQMEA